MALILIVDDSPTQVFVIKNILEKHDHQVIVAENGEQGIEMANVKRPSLILMDVVMPAPNGFQATRALSKDPITSSIPIIIISTKNQQNDKTWDLRQGEKSYLIKPLSEDVLIKEISQLLGFSDD